VRGKGAGGVIFFSVATWSRGGQGDEVKGEEEGRREGGREGG